MINRRQFLKGAVIAAPALVLTKGVLMPVREIAKTDIVIPSDGWWRVYDPISGAILDSGNISKDQSIVQVEIRNYSEDTAVMVRKEGFLIEGMFIDSGSMPYTHSFSLKKDYSYDI